MHEIQYRDSKLLKQPDQFGMADMRLRVLKKLTNVSECIDLVCLSITHDQVSAAPSGLNMT